MANILIIDDDKSIRSFLKERLASEGFTVLTAKDGKEGLNLFNNQQVDLVITDIIMPDKNGFITITELKKICPDIKIIAMSGGHLGYPEHYLDTTKCFGVQYTLAKPFKTSELLEAVYKLLPKKTTKPLTIIARIEAKKNKIDLVKSELLKLIEPTRKEQGCLQYDLYQDNHNSKIFMFYESWESRELWQAHMNNEHLKAYLAATEGAVETFTLNELSQRG